MNEIKISKNELRKISSDFRMYGNRLMQSLPDTGMGNLKRFITFIDNNLVISSFIQTNPNKEFDISSVCAYNSLKPGFKIPDESAADEISFIYQLLKYGLQKFYQSELGYWELAASVENFFGGNRKEQVNKFNHNVVKPFIYHIENYLTELQIDLGEDENAKTIHIYGDNYGNNMGATVSETNIDQSKSSIGVGVNQGEVKADKIAGIINKKEIMMSQESKKSSTFNLQNAQIAGGIVDAETVHAQHLGGNINNYAPEQRQNLVEAAVEIQQLLQQLEQTYPTNTQQEKQTVVREALKQIDSNPSLKARVVGTLKAGSIEAFKELINHPLVNILIASLEGWKEGK